MYTEELLRQNPVIIKIFLGIPADFFWQLIEQLEEQEPTYKRQQYERATHERGMGGGRHVTCR